MATIHYVGTLDRTIYSVVMADIQTDSVIITDTQIAHIKERHPDDYLLLLAYGHDMIASLDYIVEANLPYSAMVLKEVEFGGKKLKLILRLKTTADPADFQNSIISFQRIRDKE